MISGAGYVGSSEPFLADADHLLVWITVPFQVLLLILFSNFPILRRRRATWEQCRHFDYIGAVLQAASFATFVVPLLIGQPRGRDSWTSPSLISLYAISPILFSSFIYWDFRKKNEDRYLPLHAIRNNRSILALGVITMCSSIIISAGTFYLPSYLQVVRDSSPLQSAIQQLPSVLLGSVASLIVGKCLALAGTRTYQIICVFGSLLQILGGVIFWFFKPDVSWSQYYLDGIIVALGAGMLFAVGITLVLEMVPEETFGQVSSFMNVCAALGSVLGISIQGVLLQAGTEKFLLQNGVLKISNQLDAAEPRSDETNVLASSGYVVDLSNLMLQYKAAYHDSQRQASLMFAATGMLSLLTAITLTSHQRQEKSEEPNQDPESLCCPGAHAGKIDVPTALPMNATNATCPEIEQQKELRCDNIPGETHSSEITKTEKQCVFLYTNSVDSPIQETLSSQDMWTPPQDETETVSTVESESARVIVTAQILVLEEADPEVNTCETLLRSQGRR